MTGPPTLVALRALGLGDLLVAVPAFRALARAFPDHRRLLLAPRSLHVLVPLLHGAFEGALDAQPLERLPPEAHGAAVGVNLHGSGPQSHRLLLAAKVRRSLAFAHPAVPESSGGPAWDPAEHETVRWCRLLEAWGLPADPDELGIAVPALALAASQRGLTLLHPGGSSPARRWPAPRWSLVARELAARGARVAITGAAAERGLAARVLREAGLGPERNLAGRTSLLELAALVAHAGRVVSGDTGIAHLASAYGVPSLVLFGPTPPTIWGPPRRPVHRVLWSGQTGDPRASSPDPGLLAISPAVVLAELRRLDAISPTTRRLAGAPLRERSQRTRNAGP